MTELASLQLPTPTVDTLEIEDYAMTAPAKYQFSVWVLTLAGYYWSDFLNQLPATTTKHRFHHHIPAKSCVYFDFTQDRLLGF